jgi:hypothetical protein
MERIAIARPLDESQALEPPEPDRERAGELDRLQQVSFFAFAP